MKSSSLLGLDLTTTPSGNGPSVRSKSTGALNIAMLEFGLIPSFSTSDLFEYPAVIGSGSLHPRGDRPQLNICGTAFIYPNGLSAIFELPDEVGVQPGAGFHVFPGKNLIVARRNSFDVKLALRICRRHSIEIETI